MNITHGVRSARFLCYLWQLTQNKPELLSRGGHFSWVFVKLTKRKLYENELEITVGHWETFPIDKISTSSSNLDKLAHCLFIVSVQKYFHCHVSVGRPVREMNVRSVLTMQWFLLLFENKTGHYIQHRLKFIKRITF